MRVATVEEQPSSPMRNRETSMAAHPGAHRGTSAARPPPVSPMMSTRRAPMASAMKPDNGIDSA